MSPDNCWEYWDCTKDVRDVCPAYTLDSGMDCFDLAKDFCPKLEKEFKHCWECPWYKKIKSDTESEQ